jgi:myo-inositol-1(or 4)-monophosphatase
MDGVSTRPALSDRTAVASAGFDRELEVARAAAASAGAIQRRLFERLEHVKPKGRRDVVTEADYESEAVIIGAIRDAFPADAIVSEEAGALGVEMARAVDGPLGPAATARTWFIDPLDGTVNFANGLPVFCASIGFAFEGQPAVGVIYDPLRDELLRAVRGGGAWRDAAGGTAALRAGTKTDLEESLVGLVHQRGFLRTVGRIRPLVRAVRDLGSGALAVAYVGAGRLDGYLQPRGTSAWDLCAAGLIAAEGGAVVTGFDGGPWFRARRMPSRPDRAPSLGVIAAAPGIHAALLELARR